MNDTKKEFVKKYRKLIAGIVVYAFICFCCLNIFPLIAAADTTIFVRPYQRIFYFTNTAAATVSLLQHPQNIDVLAPQTYKFDVNASLQGSVNQLVLNTAAKNNIKVMPVVTNGNFDQASLSAILNDTNRQNAAIQMLITEAKAHGYMGWQIDFEQMDISYKDAFTAFVKNAYTQFKQNNLTLSVAVIAQTSNNPGDYPNNLWTKLIGVYDYTALSQNSDFVTIMAYDDPLSKEAVAPYSWIQQVLTYSLQLIPAQKISLGIPLYYWKWDNTTNKLVGIGGYGGIASALLRPGIIRGYDSTSQTAFLNYIADNHFYTVWYENAQSIQQKINLITNNHLEGFAAWTLGQESPEVFSVMN